MKLIRCNNGHFYDQDKFTSCPNCSGGTPNTNGMTEAFSDPVTTPLKETQTNFAVPNGGIVGQKVEVVQPQELVSKSLEQAFSQVSSTIPVTNPNSVFQTNSEEDDCTVAMTPSGKAMGTGGVKPVVGWLICMSGDHIGKDFRLVQGKNYIGRDTSMDICLAGEKTVSRDKHALIVYEPKHHMYLVQSGESRELTYVNDQVILESQELEKFDKIQVGDVELMFVPLCNEKFNWTDVIEGKEHADEE